MRSSTYLFTLLFATAAVSGQSPKKAFDDYYDKGKVFIVARCLSVGPVNILLRANVEVEILYVIKGQETKRTLTINSQYGMKPGEYYLLRSINEPTDKGNYFRTDDRNSVIRIVSSNEVSILPTLDPRIAVRRTMNLRAGELESMMLVMAYEKDALDAVRQDY